MDIPPTLAQELALNRQLVATSMVKHAAQMDRAMVNILSEALTVSPASRGGSLNTSA